MAKTLTQRIISGKKVSVGELRSSSEEAVVIALNTKDNSDPPTALSGEARQVFEQIKDLNLHGNMCPCWSCENQLEKFPLT